MDITRVDDIDVNCIDLGPKIRTKLKVNYSKGGRLVIKTPIMLVPFPPQPKENSTTKQKFMYTLPLSCESVSFSRSTKRERNDKEIEELAKKIREIDIHVQKSLKKVLNTDHFIYYDSLSTSSSSFTTTNNMSSFNSFQRTTKQYSSRLNVQVLLDRDSGEAIPDIFHGNKQDENGYREMLQIEDIQPKALVSCILELDSVWCIQQQDKSKAPRGGLNWKVIQIKVHENKNKHENENNHEKK